MAKENNKKKVSKIKNFKLFIFISLATLTVIIAGVLIFINSSHTKVTCKNSFYNTNTTKQSSVVTINFISGKVSSIDESRKIILNDKIDDFDGIGIIKEVLDDEYKKLKIDYNIKVKGNSLIINSSYGKKDKYILDNIMVSIENKEIGINVIQDDPQNNNLLIDLSKGNDKTSVISLFEDNNYSCK